MARKRGKKSEKQSDFNREIKDDSFARMMDESLQPVKAIEVGDEIKSTVIGIDNEYVYVDLGDRYDGAIRKGELMRYGEMLVDEGDIVTVIISGQGGGFWKCSCKLGEGEFIARDPEEVAAIMGIGEAFKTGTPVEGKITEVTKGGFDVDIMGMRAFCPLSQIDIAYCENPDEHLEKTSWLTKPKKSPTNYGAKSTKVASITEPSNPSRVSVLSSISAASKDCCTFRKSPMNDWKALPTSSKKDRCWTSP